MTKKRRFGISEALTRGLSETIHVVENHSGRYRNVVLPLSRIELDPDNPRQLTVDLSDVRHGLRPDDPQFSRKQDEMERLKELAHTIKENGVINPIVVFKNGEHYRVVAGERRCLGSILAGKQEIDARIFNERPKPYDLKLIQWVENTAREDLTLDERLGNVREIIREYQRQFGETEITATLLKNITGLSLPQMTYYMAAIHAPADVQARIKEGSIRSLDKAALLAGISSDELRARAIDACVTGASLKELRHLITQHKSMHRHHLALQSSPRGRTTASIKMGETKRGEVIKTIIDAVVASKSYHQYANVFSKVNWADMRQAAKAFRQLIEILEVEIAR